MAGPDQTGWVSQLKRIAGALGVADRISWPGMLRGDLKWGAFHSAEAFVLPSHQENFGIAVAEALGCGLPVLISDKVNIWREVHAGGGGLIGADTLAGTEDMLRRWVSLDASQRQGMSLAAKQLFMCHFTVDAMAQSLLDVVAEKR
jgi:glycosyltransferase involved in cell wall biosynthesis